MQPYQHKDIFSCDILLSVSSYVNRLYRSLVS
nr:MAG TPA: hypothetical protein [Bacteriophage sp.]